MGFFKINPLNRKTKNIVICRLSQSRNKLFFPSLLLCFSRKFSLEVLFHFLCNFIILETVQVVNPVLEKMSQIDIQILHFIGHYQILLLRFSMSYIALYKFKFLRYESSFSFLKYILRKSIRICTAL